MKTKTEKEQLKAIKDIFSVVRLASNIIKAIEGNEDYIVVEHSSKSIVDYIDSDGATAKGALEMIADHVAMLQRRFDLPEIEIIDPMSESYKTIAEVKENEIVLNKDPFHDHRIKVYKGIESKLIDHDIRDIQRLVESQENKIKKNNESI